jgi:signal transduction histidine kinase
MSAARRLRRRIDPRVIDWVLAIGLGVGGAIEVAAQDDLEGPLALNVLVMACVAVAVLVRRRRPVVGLGIWMGVALTMALFLTQPSELSALFLGLMVFPYAVGAHADGPRSWAGLGLALGTIVVVSLDSDSFVWGDIFFPGIFATMLWLAGRAVRSRSRLTAELHEAALRLHEQREAEAHAAVAEERRRIAREMHDVVAHSVSTMVIQAGGARRILARDPARAVEAAALIERTGREALGEMRHLLGVLHAGENLAALTPQPTLLELEALAERSRASGLPVELEVTGERRELPPGVDLAAYRVVQEALTNSLKHGGGRATVTVEYGERELCLEVADDGSGRGASVQGSGQGLRGMRERVRVSGGELHAGPRAGGGFAVRARLPLQNEEEAALAAAARRDPMEASA